jgi:hypothetical protein
MHEIRKPLLLVTTALPSLYEHPGSDGQAVHPHLGRLLQPRHFNSAPATAAAGIPWAADNDCFQGLDPDEYIAMLDALKGIPDCRFVTVPDRVADARETARLFEIWAPAVERRCLPVGLVLQNGIDEPDVMRWLERTWHRLDALFVGGDDSFKLGFTAAALARAAKRDGKWVHWGRINSLKRMRYVWGTGACDSMDGSSWAVFRRTLLPKGLSWCEQVAEADERVPGWQLALAA